MKSRNVFCFIVALALAVALVQDAGAFNYLLDNGTCKTAEVDRGVFYFNCTPGTNSSSITVSVPVWATSWVMSAEANPVFNSSGGAQSNGTNSTATGGYLEIFRTLAHNKTRTNSTLWLEYNSFTAVDGPAKSFTFTPQNCTQNRTATVHGFGWKR